MVRLFLYLLILNIVLIDISYAKTGIKYMSKYNTIISVASNKYSVNASAIRAVIAIESNWDPLAKRYEAGHKEYSMGLMQLLLSTAREISGNKNLTYEQLQNPITNIDLGTKYIAKQLKRYNGNYSDAIAAYNAGSVRKTIDGTYVNQLHVNKFNKWYTYYKIKEPSKMIAYALPLLAFGAVVYIRRK